MLNFDFFRKIEMLNAQKSFFEIVNFFVSNLTEKSKILRLFCNIKKKKKYCDLTKKFYLQKIVKKISNFFSGKYLGYFSKKLSILWENS